MVVGGVLQLLIGLVIANSVAASVFSCQDVRYKLINTTFAQNSRYACVVVQEDFSNWDQLKKVYAQLGKQTTSLSDITNLGGRCIENAAGTWPWSFVADHLDIDCDQQFSVILTSEAPNFIFPLKQVHAYRVQAERRVMAVPQTGMWCRIKNCKGNAYVSLATGAGAGDRGEHGEHSYLLKWWPCESDELTDYIVSFENVITIKADPVVAFEMECSSDLTTTIQVSPGDRITILANSRSNNLHNLKGSVHLTRFQIGDGTIARKSYTANMTLSFHSPKNSGEISVLQDIDDRPAFQFTNGTHSEQFDTHNFEVRYLPKGLRPMDIATSHDNILMEISIGTQSKPSRSRPLPRSKYDEDVPDVPDMYSFI